MPIDVYEKIQHADDRVDDSIALDHLSREKGRFKTLSLAGQEVRIFLERGSVLEAGQLLKSRCGQVIRVDYAPESVTRAVAPDWPTFVRASYHLGNRHVRLQIGDLWLHMLPDHVLEDLLRSFGLQIEHCQAVFVPERGAYSGHSHAQTPHHDHAHQDER